MRYVTLWMWTLPLIGHLFWGVPPAVGEANPVTNGGFEQLDDSGRPVDWEFVGQRVSVTREAHTGRYALRFVRDDESHAETGLNRAWRPHSGQGGKMLTQTRGGLSYWYKAIRGNAQFLFQAIPMSDKPLEDTGSPRVTWRVPREHIGDGQWHQAKFAYDFTDNPRVRYVHVAVRIVNGTGEMLVDDVQWLEKVGPVLSLSEAKLRPGDADPASRAILSVKLKNMGDAPIPEVTLEVRPEADLQIAWKDPLRAPIPPSEEVTASWWVLGRRVGRGTLHVSARLEDQRQSTQVTYEPQLEIQSLLAEPFLLPPGETSVLTATVVNRGTSASEPEAIQLIAEEGVTLLSEAVQPMPAIETAGSAQLSWKVRASQEGAFRLRCAAEEVPFATSRLIVTDAAGASAQVEHLVGPLWLRRGSRRTIVELRNAQGQRIGWLPALASVWMRPREKPPEVLHAGADEVQRRSEGRQVVLRSQRRDSQGGRWQFSVSFTEGPNGVVRGVWHVSSDQPRDVLAFEGPVLYALGPHQEALFPGLEWLVGGEVSNSDRDIARTHPDWRRYVPHPNKVTVPLMAVRTPHGLLGLFWDMKQQWNGEHDRPQPIFAVPDRFSGRNAHLMGLMAPNVPWGMEENTRLAKTPVRLGPGKRLTLSAQIAVLPESHSVLDALDVWFAEHDAQPPLAWPQGDPVSQFAFSMQGYMKSLWEGPEEGWWPYLGGPALGRKPSHRPDFAYDLLMGARLAARSPEEKAAWEARARDQLQRANAFPAGDDLGFRFRDPRSAILGRLAAAERNLASMREDGTWRFDADRKDQGVFKGFDYHELGPDEAVELGTLARRCYEVLWYARLTGDWEAYERMLPTLERMTQFQVPRAAQVWEVPVHTPDILAAADAMDAFLEAYGISGESRWLEEARRWARAGVPFIYVWDAGHPERPWMRYGSIPVFGASWFRASWFGRIVQWNGLRYAYALLKLASYDPQGGFRGGPSWRTLAEGITISASYQQSTEGANLALWPDSYGTIDGHRANWEFPPKQILKNLSVLMGVPDEPATILLSPGHQVEARAIVSRDEAPEGVLHAAISASGRLKGATWQEERLQVTVRGKDWPGPPGYLLVAGVTEPRRVSLAAPSEPEPVALERREEPPSSWETQDRAWWYDPAFRLLRVALGESTEQVLIEGVRPAAVSLLAMPADQIRFEFETGPEGWQPTHDLEAFRVRQGVLVMQITGGDPYFTRSQLRVPAASVAALTLRVRTDRPGGIWQVFFATQDSPYYEEAKSVRFPGPQGRDWEVLRVPLASHPAWKGRITSLRIDPPGWGGQGSPPTVALDWIRTEEP